MSTRLKPPLEPKAEAEPKTSRPAPAHHFRDPLMTVTEVATYVRMSKSYFDKARLAGEGFQASEHFSRLVESRIKSRGDNDE